MCEILHTRHIARLKSGTCAIENGVVFLEIITNLERIADHCSNVAARLIGTSSADEEFDAHELRRRLHDGYVKDYNVMLQAYEDKYIPAIKSVN